MGKDMITTITPTGAIGHEPFHEASFFRGLEENPNLDFIGADAGSGDIGPYYLGADAEMNPASWTEHDLELLLVAARERNIPLIIGSAGGTGTRRGVDDYVSTVKELARVHGLAPFQLARIYSDVSLDFLRDNLEDPPIESLTGGRPLSEEVLRKTSRVVGMMGVAPYIEALDRGADVIIAGRSCDDAIFACFGIRQGFPKGLSYHMGKVLECASLVGSPSMSKESVIGRLTEEFVEIEPMHPEQRCTPESVAGHALYERSHPYFQDAPGGTLDTRAAVYEQISDRSTRFTGSEFVQDERYRIKLEGAAFVGYRSLAIGALRDPLAIERLDEITDRVRKEVRDRVGQLNEGADYVLLFHAYGKNAVMGDREHHTGRLHEIGLVVETIGESQAIADEVTRLAFYRLLFPTFTGQKATAGGLAMIADEILQGTPKYRWTVDHLLDVAEPLELFPISVETVSGKE